MHKYLANMLSEGHLPIANLFAVCQVASVALRLQAMRERLKEDKDYAGRPKDNQDVFTPSSQSMSEYRGKKDKQTDSCGVMSEITVRNEELVLQ